MKKEMTIEYVNYLNGLSDEDLSEVVKQFSDKDKQELLEISNNTGRYQEPDLEEIQIFNIGDIVYSGVSSFEKLEIISYDRLEGYHCKVILPESKQGYDIIISPMAAKRFYK